MWRYIGVVKIWLFKWNQKVAVNRGCEFLAFEVESKSGDK